MNGYNVQSYLENAARNYPAKNAVLDEKSCITYKILNDSSSRLAHIISNIASTKSQRIAFILKRSTNCIPVIFGILKSNATYIPIDAKTPVNRLELILNDSKPDAIICDNTTENKVLDYRKNNNMEINIFKIIMNHSHDIDLASIYSARQNINTSRHIISNNDLAYIMYTSGSTGSPKGVLISHANIYDYIDWAIQYFSIKDENNILCTAPLSFDMSTFDIYCAIKSGSTLCIADDATILFPEKLLKFIEANNITIWKSISSLLMYIDRAGALKKGRIPSVKKIIFAGETLPTKYLISWMQTFPDIEFYNGYGPTEATGVSLCHKIIKTPVNSNEKIPIGLPRKNTKVYLLREDNSYAGINETAELHISGPGISKGYLNDFQKTSNSFIQNPFVPGEIIYKTGDLVLLREDGNYEFIGRKDEQVKYMGYRIELGEIQHAMLSLDGIEDAATILFKNSIADLNEITAFYVSENSFEDNKLVSKLKEKLPDYMIPRRFIKIYRIPRNQREKIEKDALRLLITNDRN